MFVRLLVGLSARLHKTTKLRWRLGLSPQQPPWTLVWVQIQGRILELFLSLSFKFFTWFKPKLKNLADLGGWCLWLSTEGLLTAALVSSGFTWLWIKEAGSGGCRFDLHLHVEVSSSKKLMTVPSPCKCVWMDDHRNIVGCYKNRTCCLAPD